MRRGVAAAVTGLGLLRPLRLAALLLPLHAGPRALPNSPSADDFLILVRTRVSATRVMAAVVRFVEGKLKLLVNAAKSRVAPLARCTFLGFRFSRGEIRWSKEA